MIGRQNVHLRESEATSLSEEFHVAIDAKTFAPGAYAEELFFNVFGSKRVVSVDASEYEGATMIHDLNKRLGEEHDQQYDAVVDGGSLEHIFGVPTAVASMMRATKVGGRIYAVWPANNLCGHGFFQFSPEFAYRVFDPAHGFEAERVALVESRFLSTELDRRRLVLDVTDPRSLSQRVLRKSTRTSLLMVQALKLRHLDEPFAMPPQQSDYVAHQWSANERTSSTRGSRSRELLSGLRELARASRYNRAGYRRSS
jgi:hypothetical protein